VQGSITVKINVDVADGIGEYAYYGVEVNVAVTVIVYTEASATDLVTAE
jgi:hypothetical protein